LDIAPFWERISRPRSESEATLQALRSRFFTGGALRNNLRLAKSQDRQALISYEQTIQRAFGDVLDALIGYEKYHGVRERQEQMVKDLQESVDVSLMRYRGRTANYITSSTACGRYFKPNSRWRRRETTNTRAWCSFTKRWAAVGSRTDGSWNMILVLSDWRSFRPSDGHSMATA
jgi:hypothetical protein